MVGLSGLEPPTSRLSGVRSNQLSYRPINLNEQTFKTEYNMSRYSLIFVEDVPNNILRKEVIQPHLPIRLPCYDFTPIICPTFDG